MTCPSLEEYGSASQLFHYMRLRCGNGRNARLLRALTAILVVRRLQKPFQTWLYCYILTHHLRLL